MCESASGAVERVACDALSAKKRSEWSVGDLFLARVPLCVGAARGKPFVGAYVSCARGTRLDELCSALVAHCKRLNKSPASCYVWLDCLVGDLAVVADAASLAKLAASIARFQQGWVVCQDWDDTDGTLRRLWCAWELRQMLAPVLLVASSSSSTSSLMSKGRVDAIVRTVGHAPLLCASREQSDLIQSHTPMDAIQTALSERTAAALAEATLSAVDSQANVAEAGADLLVFIASHAPRGPLRQQLQLDSSKNALRLLGEAARASKQPLQHAAILAKAAAIAGDMGDTQGALARLAKAQAIYKAAHDKVSEHKTLASMAELLASKGKRQEALARRTEALQLLSAEPKDAPAAQDNTNSHALALLRADAIINLADAHASMDNLHEALALCQQAHEIRKETLGAQHALVGEALNCVANAQASCGRLHDALASYRAALEIFERAHGEAHLTVFVALNNIAVVLNDMGHPAEALEILQQTLLIINKPKIQQEFDKQARQYTRSTMRRSAAPSISNRLSKTAHIADEQLPALATVS